MFDNITEIISEQQNLLRRDNIEEFLERMFRLFLELSNAPQLRGKQINSGIFDELCQAAGQTSAFELYQQFQPAEDVPYNVILVTELTVQGGHVEIIKDILRNSKLPVILLVTNIHNKKDPILRTISEECDFSETVLIEDNRLLEKLRLTQSVINHPKVHRVYLLSHPYDSVAIAAITPSIAKKALFLHHCDHTPCLGSHLVGVEHLDLHNIGFSRCRHEHNLTNNRYLCLTSAGEDIKPKRTNFSKPVFTSATCGSIHKLQNMDYHLSYKDQIVQVLKNKKGIHYHIGYLPGDFLSGMANLLEMHGIEENQFCYLGEAPGLATILSTLDVDLYIPTMPLSGGKALVDAMAAGVPILLHQHARDRIWGSIDLVYPEAPTWRDLKEMNAILDQFDERYWQQQSKASRAYFERFHNNKMFSEQLERAGLDINAVDIPPLKPYRPDIGAFLHFARNS
ncbi:hypothetical protein GJ700_06655 [Duganella sp. FT92W]|uniref:Glycosyltransferase n=1 Tax=Pseudoduganella rivuli TaxID=2666085 RepID=A0A7X2LT31_9BURK|nr:hypothetical protein [Pseudoduganella rivuli]MRV71399.1 hypothetical protein [Pseudoduganella rivuli]